MFDSLYLFFYELVLYVDLFFCKVLGILYSFFDVFAGVKNVTFDGVEKPLVNVFFEDTPAARIYAAMAIIGIALSFAFTIYAVIKKIFDLDDKVKNSLGGILGNQLKCIIFILLMNFVILMVLKASNTLMERVVYIFNNEPTFSRPDEIHFDSTQYATMGRVMNTIGNYSLNPSFDSRYNINTCYNEIRRDMSTLRDQGVFAFAYDDDDAKESWQYYLTQIANSHDLDKAQNIDEYDEALVAAMVTCMEKIAISRDFRPIQEYHSNIAPIRSDETPFDALIFLAGTSSAAKNEEYNKNPDIFDTLRYDYIKPDGKSIYDVPQVEGDFDISFSKFDHLAIILLGVILAKVFLSLCVNCVARIFNLMLLYLIAPVFIATTPLDDGEKTKQWSTAFIVQAFAVFGSVIGIRILMLFVTMTFNAELVLFENTTLNFFAKLIMIFAVACTLDQASKIVTGILANNAGFQSIQASDVGSTGAARLTSSAQNMGRRALGVAAGTAGVAKSMLKYSVFGTAGNWAASKFTNSGVSKLFGVGEGSKAAFDRKNEAAKNPPKDDPGKKMAESADKMATAAQSFAESMRNYRGGGSEASGGGSSDSKDNASKSVDAKNNRNMGTNTEGGNGDGQNGSNSDNKTAGGGKGSPSGRRRANSLPNRIRNYNKMNKK